MKAQHLRPLFVILGCVSLGLGLVGIFLPLLPTTPFLLLSAALFMRSSQRLYDWLLNHKTLGPYIRNFRENRAIPLRVKIISVTLMWITMGYSILCVVENHLWAQLLLLAAAVGVTWHIRSFKTLKKS